MDNLKKNNNIIEQKTGILSDMSNMLVDASSDEIPREKSLIMPMSELALLGAGFSELITSINKMNQIKGFKGQVFYKLANEEVGDVLKIAKNGNFWGAFKTASGKSKFAQLKKVGTDELVDFPGGGFNPSIMMMAVAIHSIEKELKNIAEMEKQIITFLENEKMSEIEADVKTLGNIIEKYKYNWNNERFIASNHKMVADIQKQELQNISFYQKEIKKLMKEKKMLIADNKLNNYLMDMKKKFKYYRLCVYSYALASLLEIMLSGNFTEENINIAIKNIQNNSEEYRSIFGECSINLEELSGGSIKKYLLKGVGNVENVTGNIMLNMPKGKNAQLEEYINVRGEKLKNKAREIKSEAQDISRDIIKSFAEVNNPETGVFVRKLEDMNSIYNYTKDICFDSNNIYLVME